MMLNWDGRSATLNGADWRGKRIKITPNTNVISIECAPDEIHIRLPSPEVASSVQEIGGRERSVK